jgi:hypothetical protein
LADPTVMDMDGGRSGLRATALVALMLMSAFVGIAAPKVEAALNPIPVLTLSLTPTQLMSKVTNSQNGPVMFGGNATVEKLSGSVERVTVTLAASCIWPAIISPSTMVFTASNRPQAFFVTVVVPPKTSSQEVGTLIVSGTAKAPGLSIVTASANAVITVGQFYKLSIGSDTPLREVGPGDITYNTINIYNEGNGLDSFELEVSNSKELIKKDFNVIIERTSIDVKQDEYAQIKITIQTPQKWHIYIKEIHIITVKVTSAEARNQQILYSQQFSLSIFMKGMHIPGFDPLLAVLAVGIVAAGIRTRQGRGPRRRLVG